MVDDHDKTDADLRATLLELSDAIAVAASERARREAVTAELERYRELALTAKARGAKKALRMRSPLSKRVARKVKNRAKGYLPDRSVRQLTGTAAGPNAGALPADLEADISTIFDPEYYAEKYRDVAASGLSPWAHFKGFGFKKNRRPGPLFDPNWYASPGEPNNPIRMQPLVHYLRKGYKAGHDPIPEFDSAWYLKTYPEVALMGMNPLVHYISAGAKHGCDPNPVFNSMWYLQQYPEVASAGMNPLSHYLVEGQADGRLPSPSGDVAVRVRPKKTPIRSISDEIERKYPYLASLRVAVTDAPVRVNMITDSLNSESLFGGVATAAIAAALWAQETGARLRVVTRRQAYSIEDLADLLEMNDIKLDQVPECIFIPEGPGDSLEISSDDLFLTTSWWTTNSTLKSIPPERVVYILQEDERLLYPSGDEQLRAQSTMNTLGIRVLVNTQGLLDHLIATGVENLRDTAVSFEPSFSLYPESESATAPDQKRQLFFYARIGNPRNLFQLGLEVLDRAIQDGVIDTTKWTINFAGSRIPRVEFSDGTIPEYHEELPWREYRNFISGIDLGLSLMATPYPSYPPLDLAASGALVVTNIWPGKQDLAKINDRSIAVDSDVESLVRGLAEGIRRVESGDVGTGSCVPYSPSWNENLQFAVSTLRGSS